MLFFYASKTHNNNQLMESLLNILGKHVSGLHEYPEYHVQADGEEGADVPRPQAEFKPAAVPIEALNGLGSQYPVTVVTQQQQQQQQMARQMVKKPQQSKAAAAADAYKTDVQDRFSKINIAKYGLFPHLEELHYEHLQTLTGGIGVIGQNKQSVVDRATDGDELALYLPFFKIISFSFMIDKIMYCFTCFVPTYTSPLYNKVSRIVEVNPGVVDNLDDFFGTNDNNKPFKFIQKFIEDKKKTKAILDGGAITNNLAIVAKMEISDVSCLAVNKHDSSDSKVLDQMRIGLRFPGLLSSGWSATRSAISANGRYTVTIPSGCLVPREIKNIAELENTFTDIICGTGYTPTVFATNGTIVQPKKENDYTKKEYYGASDDNYVHLTLNRIGFFLTLMYNLCEWMKLYKETDPNHYIINCGFTKLEEWDLVMAFDAECGDMRFFNQHAAATDNYVGKLLYILSPKDKSESASKEVPIPSIGGSAPWKLAVGNSLQFTLSVPSKLFSFCLGQYSAKIEKINAVRKDSVTVTAHIEGECNKRIGADYNTFISFAVKTESIDAVSYYTVSKYPVAVKKDIKK